MKALDRTVLVLFGILTVSSASFGQPPVDTADALVTKWEARRKAAGVQVVTLTMDVTEHKRKHPLGEGWLIPEDRRHTETIRILLAPEKGWYRIDTTHDRKDAKTNSGVSVFYQNELRSGSFPNAGSETVADKTTGVIADFVVASGGFHNYPLPLHLYPVLFAIGTCPLSPQTQLLPNNWSNLDLRQDLDLVSLRRVNPNQVSVLCGPVRLSPEREVSIEYDVSSDTSARVLTAKRKLWTKRAGQQTVESLDIDYKAGTNSDPNSPSGWKAVRIQDGVPTVTKVVKVQAIEPAVIAPGEEAKVFAVTLRDGMKALQVKEESSADGQKSISATLYDVSKDGALVDPEVVVPSSAPSRLWIWIVSGLALGVCGVAVSLYLLRRRKLRR